MKLQHKLPYTHQIFTYSILLSQVNIQIIPVANAVNVLKTIQVT
jgi:hypothetical protein